MKAYQVNDPDKLNTLLSESDAFDEYELTELTLTKDVTCHVDGRKIGKAETTANGCDYIKFCDVRPLLSIVMKSSETDNRLKLSLFHRAAGGECITGGFINIVPQEDSVMVTSAVSYRTFTLDRSLEEAWDRYVNNLLTAHDLI